MAAVLRHQFGRFQSVGRQLHAVAVLLEHSADEFAHADGMLPRAIAVEPGANIRAALALACIGRRSLGSVATMRFKSISRMRLPSGAIVVPGKSFTRRRYSPRFLITISSLPRTSSTTRPIFRFPAFATTIRKYPLIVSRGGKPR